MIDKVWWIVKLYIPPKPGDDAHLLVFQWAQSVAILGIWTVAWVLGLWLIGKLPFIPQIAWAKDVAAVSVKVDTVDDKLGQMLLLQLQTNISQRLKDTCLAQRAGNQSDLDTANQQLSALLDTYFQMKGRPYNLPGCNTVLVDTHT